jgi:hypothetical protein
MRDTRLDAIRQRVASAPGGPWRWVSTFRGKGSNDVESLRAERLDAYGEEVARDHLVPTADDFRIVLWGDTYQCPTTGRTNSEIRFQVPAGDLIANAREDLAYLLRMVDSLTAKLSEYSPVARR